MIIDKVVSAQKVKIKRKVNKGPPSGLQKNGKLIKVIKSLPSYQEKVDETDLSTDSFDNKVNKRSVVTSLSSADTCLSCLIGPL